MKPDNRETHKTPQPETEAPPIVRRSTLDNKPAGLIRRLLGEPLVHFFIVGALVFGAYWLYDTEPAVADSQQIEISENDVRQIVVAWLAQGRPPLTRDQLQSLIDQKVAEEVLFREGLALGLDRNDEIIKRRVAQKMDFLAADVATLQEPEKAGLQEWYSENSERFSLPPRMSFRHLYFSPDLRGSSTQSDAQAALDLIAGKAINSEEVIASADPFILRSYYSNASPNLVVKEFGPAFATDLFKLESGDWRGPIQSGYGWHLVWTDSIEPGRIPSFEEVETAVRTAWRDQRYLEIKQAALEEMRARYTVVLPSLDTIDMSNLLGTSQQGNNPSDSAPQ